MTRIFSRLGGKTMGGELRQEVVVYINGVVARRGSSVYKQTETPRGGTRDFK